MVEFTTDEGEIDFDAFAKEDPETFDIYCNLTIEEIDTCINEIYKCGDYGYTATIEALRDQREDVRNMYIEIPYPPPRGNA